MRALMGVSSAQPSIGRNQAFLRMASFLMTTKATTFFNWIVLTPGAFQVVLTRVMLHALSSETARSTPIASRGVRLVMRGL